MKITITALTSFFTFIFLANAESPSYFFFSPETTFSYVKDYSEDEQAAILKDLAVVKSANLPSHKNCSNQRPLYLATAGAPGARKTTILERFMRRYILNAHMTYLDPDQRALKFMTHTYRQSLSGLAINGSENYIEILKGAYEKWRGASNYITFTLLEDAFANRQNIAHGTTSTAENIPGLLSKVKQAGYEIILLLCYAEESSRNDAIEYRNNEQKFYQSTPEDSINKGKIFPMRMQAYFTYADSLHLFWSDTLFNQESLAATLSNGKLTIYDSRSLNKFICQFEKDRDRLVQER